MARRTIPMIPQWLDRAARFLNGRRDDGQTESRQIEGFRVDVTNTRDDVDTEQVFARARRVLERVRLYQPWRFAHLRRDVAGIVVKRYPCRGANFADTRTCLLELTFMVNPGFSDSQVAASLVHEGMHARLDRLVERFGIRSHGEAAARHERICRRAEIHFGQAVPDGAPVIARASETLALGDDEVAPTIDWAEAQRRVSVADREAAGDQ